MAVIYPLSFVSSCLNEPQNAEEVDNRCQFVEYPANNNHLYTPFLQPAFSHSALNADRVFESVEPDV